MPVFPFSQCLRQDFDRSWNSFSKKRLIFQFSFRLTAFLFSQIVSIVLFVFWDTNGSFKRNNFPFQHRNQFFFTTRFTCTALQCPFVPGDDSREFVSQMQTIPTGTIRRERFFIDKCWQRTPLVPLSVSLCCSVALFEGLRRFRIVKQQVAALLS